MFAQHSKYKRGLTKLFYSRRTNLFVVDLYICHKDVNRYISIISVLYILLKI